MPKKKEACARCKQTVDAGTLIQCPACNDECCEDCIAGVGVDCFQCEDADIEASHAEDDVEEDEDDDGGVIDDEDADGFDFDSAADFLEDDNDIEEDHG